MRVLGVDDVDIVLGLELTLAVRGCASVCFDSDGAMNKTEWRGYTAGDETNATQSGCANKYVDGSLLGNGSTYIGSINKGARVLVY